MRKPYFGSECARCAMAVAVLAVSGATALADSTAPVPLMVFAGQSNMVGYGSSYYDLTAAQQATQPNVDYYYIDGQTQPHWSALTPPTELDDVAYWGTGPTPAVGFGPEISVGQDLVNAGIYPKVAEVKTAFNGTFLATQAQIPAAAGMNGNWNPSTPVQSGVYTSYYQAMLGNVAAAQQSYGQPTEVSAFFWMQGESDAEYASTADAYESNLISLIAAVRASFNNPNLPFIYGRIEDSSAFPYLSTVRAAEDAVAQLVPNVYEVDTDDLPLRYDLTHFTSDGEIELGNRFASGLMNLLNTATWNGGGANKNWTTANNWGGTAPTPSFNLNFSGNAGITNNNNFTAGTQFNGMQFPSGGGAFVLNGNSINLGGNVVNNSTSLQTVNTPLVLLQTVAFDAISGDMTFGGVISGSFGLLVNGPGNVTFSAVNGYTGDTTVNGGTLKLAVPGSLPGGANLTINAGGSVVAENLGTSSRVHMNVSGITITETGTLDLTDNDMTVIAGGEAGYAIVNGYVAAGRGTNGQWTGAGITSSLAAGSPGRYAVGVVVNDTVQDTTGKTALSGTPLMSTFDGQQVEDGDVLVKFTYAGDANLDGVVDANDYIQIDNGFNSQSTATPLAGWYNGDFNYDGVINGDDFTLIDNAYNTQGSVRVLGIGTPTEMIASSTEQIAQVSSSSVPEPGSLALLAIGAAGLLRRRWQRERSGNRRGAFLIAD